MSYLPQAQNQGPLPTQSHIRWPSTDFLPSVMAANRHVSSVLEAPGTVKAMTGL